MEQVIEVEKIVEKIVEVPVEVVVYKEGKEARAAASSASSTIMGDDWSSGQQVLIFFSLVPT